MLRTPISCGANGPGFNGRPKHPNLFEIPAPEFTGRIKTAWYTVVENFRGLEGFDAIEVAPAVGSNGGASIRLAFTPSVEEPVQVTIAIYADGE